MHVCFSETQFLFLTPLSPLCPHVSQLPPSLTETSLGLFQPRHKASRLWRDTGHEGEPELLSISKSLAEVFQRVSRFSLRVGSDEDTLTPREPEKETTTTKPSASKDSCSLLQSRLVWESLPGRGTLAFSPALPSTRGLKGRGSLP